MKKDIKKGRKVTSPFIRKPYLVSCYGFKINGSLLSFPVSNRRFANILLNSHTSKILSDNSLESRSFIITPNLLSITIRKQVEPITPESVIGTDRNLRNVAILTPNDSMYKTNKILSIKESQFVKEAFSKNDKRVKNRFYTKIRGRQTRHVIQFLHISKNIIQKSLRTGRTDGNCGAVIVARA